MNAKVHPDTMLPMAPPPPPGTTSNMLAMAPPPPPGTTSNMLAMGARAMGAILPFKKKTSIGVAPPDPESTLDPNSYSVANATNPGNKALPLPWPSPKQGGRKSRKRRISRKRRVSRKFKKTRRPKRRKQ